MKLLLHTCCAPCSIYCIEHLKALNISPTIYWYNPNIEPYEEYEKRKDTLQEHVKKIDIDAVFDDDTNSLDSKNCYECYRIRLDKTAKYAKENDYNAFTTTLLISPYQNHELLKQLGEEMAEKYSIQFLYADFREGFRTRTSYCKRTRFVYAEVLWMQK